MRILVTGAAGSGTSTLGRALAVQAGGLHLDADDYFWLPTTPRYTAKRNPADRLTLMLAALASADTAVISGSVCGWGAQLEESFSGIVFLTVPASIRIERLRARDLRQFGSVDPAFLD